MPEAIGSWRTNCNSCSTPGESTPRCSCCASSSAASRASAATCRERSVAWGEMPFPSSVALTFPSLSVVASSGTRRHWTDDAYSSSWTRMCQFSSCQLRRAWFRHRGPRAQSWRRAARHEKPFAIGDTELGLHGNSSFEVSQVRIRLRFRNQSHRETDLLHTLFRAWLLRTLV